MLVLSCLALALPALALPAEPRRDILGLLGGTPSALSPPDPTLPVLHTLDPFSRSSVSPSGTAILAASSPEQWTPTPTPPTDSSQPTTVKTAVASTPSLLPASAESHATDHSSKTWQIIGIAIIAVLFIAISISCAMFFDRLWRFLKDAVCCASHPLAAEEFIPDCEKQNWDTRTLSPSPSDFDHYKAESLHEGATIRARELPWNSDTQDWNTLHRQPSQQNDHPPAT